jgi:Ankyrin repeats (3 copies)
MSDEEDEEFPLYNPLPKTQADPFASFERLEQLRARNPATAYLIPASMGPTAAQLDDAFVYAAQQGQLAVIERRVSIGQHVNGVDADGNTALHACCHRGHTDVMELLLRNNANLDARDRHGDTALHTGMHKVLLCSYDKVLLCRAGNARIQ